MISSRSKEHATAFALWCSSCVLSLSLCFLLSFSGLFDCGNILTLWSFRVANLRSDAHLALESQTIGDVLLVFAVVNS